MVCGSELVAVTKTLSPLRTPVAPLQSTVSEEVAVIVTEANVQKPVARPLIVVVAPAVVEVLSPPSWSFDVEAVPAFSNDITPVPVTLRLVDIFIVVDVALVLVLFTMSRLLIVEVALFASTPPVKNARPVAANAVVVALVIVLFTITKFVIVEVALLTRSVPSVAMFVLMVVAA